jgi:hypothetical protein
MLCLAYSGNKLVLDALLMYAKIPNDQARQLMCLEAIFGYFYENFDWSKEQIFYLARLENELIPEALITCGKIPSNQARQLMCLEAIFKRFCENFDWSKEQIFYLVSQKNELISYAILMYAKIPGDNQKTRGIACLEAIFKYFCGNFNWLQTQIDYLANLGSKSVLECLITYAKIRSNNQKTRGIACLEAIFKHFCKNFNWSIGQMDYLAWQGNEQLLDSLFVYAKIHGNIVRQLMCLKAIFRHFCRDFEWIPEKLNEIGALNNQRVLEALLQRARIKKR